MYFCFEFELCCVQLFWLFTNEEQKKKKKLVCDVIDIFATCASHVHVTHVAQNGDTHGLFSPPADFKC